MRPLSRAVVMENQVRMTVAFRVRNRATIVSSIKKVGREGNLFIQSSRKVEDKVEGIIVVS